MGCLQTCHTEGLCPYVQGIHGLPGGGWAAHKSGQYCYFIDVHGILLDQNFSPSNIINYMAGTRSQFILYGLDTTPLKDERIHLFQKSLTYTRPLCPKTSYINTTEILSNILSVSGSLEFPIIFQALYTFCFFSFLRLSNLLPYSRTSFDPTRQLCRGDLIFSSDTITVIIKWSKTIQNRRNTTTICVPALGRSPLCPYSAVRLMLDNTPGSPNDPLFQVTTVNGRSSVA